MSNYKQIIEKIEEQYNEDSIAGMIDEQMLDYVDQDQCDEEFDGDTYECYCETGNNAAEGDIFHQLIRWTGIEPTEDDWDDLAEWWKHDMGFML